MFCFQCQETAQGTGCTIAGVCGKKDDLANMQDLLIYTSKGVSIVNNVARELGLNKKETDDFIVRALFMTITNANWDKQAFYDTVRTGIALREEIKSVIEAAGHNVENTSDFVTWSAVTNNDLEIKSASQEVSILATKDEDIRSLRELVVYGVKGMAAYLEHANNLDYDNDELHAYMQKALAEVTNDELTMEDLVNLAMECGKYGVEAMELLDKANTTTYGSPEITKVNIGVRNNPGILISGHDLKDMEDLLKQTEGTGVDVYTHSEMLPANYYPAFKKYDHFVGNYGNAWWEQTREFDSFNGPILMTTNCIVPPKSSYKNRMYTTGATAVEGVIHIDKNEDGTKDFSAIIEHAKTCEPPTEIENGEIVGGFAHEQVSQLAGDVVEAVKSGAIKRFFVMAGCDGRHKSREYYKNFAEELPSDTVILTAGCAKYRYNKLDLGDINGIPRVLDAGQCNDSYSLIMTALKLKDAFGLESVNDLPLSYNIAWYEQKAVIVFLSLLYLDVQNIHVGPTLPAFLSDNVKNFLIEKFNIGGITNTEDDINMFMNGEVTA
ncbi:hydroxylamine reductase [Desertibacillus haloalkaliphilus]|uniref:hydroxylamine reductase n=1 Tax=Desertibacillus haloalkaliphilus TaxID=1328930 RepID=UPI001C273768|nr:hydroxylamine reductase [Desertibacillus haloalkaliphilus]MBU8907695.1 hydroxylamine reductase [Desertibacillus haloalkaliphilus]